MTNHPGLRAAFMNYMLGGECSGGPRATVRDSRHPVGVAQSYPALNPQLRKANTLILRVINL